MMFKGEKGSSLAVLGHENGMRSKPHRFRRYDLRCRNPLYYLVYTRRKRRPPSVVSRSSYIRRCVCVHRSSLHPLVYPIGIPIPQAELIISQIKTSPIAHF